MNTPIAHPSQPANQDSSSLVDQALRRPAASSSKTGKGTGTWNNQLIVENTPEAPKGTGPAWRYRAVLHMRHAIAANEVARYQQCLRSHTVADRKQIADLIRTMGGFSPTTGLDIIAKDYEATGSTPWSIRIYHDYNRDTREPLDWVEITLEGIFPEEAYDDIKEFLENPNHQPGMGRLLAALEGDAAAQDVLNGRIPKPQATALRGSEGTPRAT